ncbi:MAG: chromosomal replication initiator protein DnaA [Clostridia bacterium]|nr:chromosomal replication initiator protein DnaA [Clostridia bacterium]
MDTIADVWKEVLAVCSKKVSEPIYKMWIAPLELVKFEKNTFIFVIGSEFKKSIIMDQFSGIIKDAFEEVMGFPVEIDIFVNGAVTQEEEKKPETTDAKSDLGGGLRQYTFDNFIVGKSNNFAYNVSLGVAEHPGSLYNPLLIYGRSGLGKTHLLFAIYNRLKENNPDKVIIYVTGESFMNELVVDLKNHNTIAFHEKYRNVDALLVDDIQFIQRGASVQEEFFHTFNALEQAGKQIVITSDVPPREMEILDERLRTRFEMGIIADIQPPDIDTRKAIILRKCEQLDITLPDAVVDLIAQKIKNNVRQIEGTVKKISAMMNAYSRTVTVEQVQDIIKDITTDNQPTAVVVKKIIEFVAKSFGVTANDILSDNRQSNIALARQLCMYVIKEVTDLKLNEIGKYFNKNHSTVLHSIAQAKEKMDKNPSVKAAAVSAINEFQTKNN